MKFRIAKKIMTGRSCYNRRCEKLRPLQILDFLEKYSPEKLDARFIASLDKLSAEAAKKPLTEQQKENLAAIEPWIIALTVFGFGYIMYLIFF